MCFCKCITNKNKRPVAHSRKKKAVDREASLFKESTISNIDYCSSEIERLNIKVMSANLDFTIIPKHQLGKLRRSAGVPNSVYDSEPPGKSELVIYKYKRRFNLENCS